MKIWPPQDQVFWYLNRPVVVSCTDNIHVDVAIIGGGMAGLSAAQAFHARGKKVALLEQYYCGAGASGRSSGFITPNAELSLTDFCRMYGQEKAQTIWNFFISGTQDIRNNILTHNFSCDYTPQDTLVVANTAADYAELETEYTTSIDCGYTTAHMYPGKTVQEYIGSSEYVGGMGYTGSFGIGAYRYCQELKNHLQSVGVDIYEETPVTAVDGHVLRTLYADITADTIIVCMDRYAPDLQFLVNEVYHVQTFLMISQVLSDEQVHALFPAGRRMCWDTDTIYTYFRLTGDNRLLLGGGNFGSGYSYTELHGYEPMRKKLNNYFAEKFPSITLQFEQMWPGLIGISKDIVPLAGRDNNRPYMYYIAGAAGLTLAAALGRYSAEHMIDGRTELDEYFSPYRVFRISGVLQRVLGKKYSFMLSHMLR